MTDFATTLRVELSPSHERWRNTLLITLVCVMTAGLCMILDVPEAALSCYLVFFAWKDNSGSAVVTGLMLVTAVSLGLLVGVPLLQLSADNPMWRIGMLVGFSVVGMTLANASRIRPILGAGTFVLVFAVTLYDVVPIPEILTRLLAWMWVVVFIPMALIPLTAIFLGETPLQRAEALIAQMRAAVAVPQSAMARWLLEEAGSRFDEYFGRARMFGQVRGIDADRLAAEGEAAYLALARAEAGLPPREGPPAPATPVEKQPVITPDLFHDPAHIRFGIKVMVASLATYLFYTSAGAFEIHTAMITCYFVALGTGAETRHKMTLRLTGAVLGAILGALVLFFLMPHLTDFGHLLIVVALGALPAAWISLGSERVSYAGWQLALCYFLVILGSSGPATDIAVATNRVLGILVGIAAVWIVFSLLWPVSSRDTINAELDLFDTGMAACDGDVLRGRDVMELYAHLAEVRRLQHYTKYEGARAEEEAVRLGEARARLHRQLKYATGEPHA